MKVSIIPLVVILYFGCRALAQDVQTSKLAPNTNKIFVTNAETLTLAQALTASLNGQRVFKCQEVQAVQNGAGITLKLKK